jgi:hypothetical protein
MIATTCECSACGATARSIPSPRPYGTFARCPWCAASMCRPRRPRCGGTSRPAPVALVVPAATRMNAAGRRRAKRRGRGSSARYLAARKGGA